MKTTTDLFSKVNNAINDAILIAWDGCHKMYLAMDAEQAAWFRAEYPYVVQHTPAFMLATLKDWWEQSCSLRFVSAVSTNHANPNAGYESLIPQFAEEDDEVECDRCGVMYVEASDWFGLCRDCADEENEED